MGPELTILMTVGKAVMGFAGAMSQARAQERAAKEQRAAAERSAYLADRNAANIERETAERSRRQAKAQRAQEKIGLARAAASGGAIAGSASTQAYFEELQDENQRALDWLMETGRSKSESERMRGEFARQTGYAQADVTESRASATRTGAFGDLASGLFSAAGDMDFGGASKSSVSPSPPALDSGWDYYYPTTYSMT